MSSEATAQALPETGPEAQFRAYLSAGRFMIQRSRSSGRYVFFPRVAVPGTGEQDLEWVHASGQGVVHSVTIVRPRPPAGPYNVALVELAEGPRMISRVEGMPPEAVQIGLRVTARVADGDTGRYIVFDPAQ